MYRYLGQLEGWAWGEEQQEEKQVAEWGRTGVREEIGGQKQHPTRGNGHQRTVPHSEVFLFLWLWQTKGGMLILSLKQPVFQTCKINF